MLEFLVTCFTRLGGGSHIHNAPLLSIKVPSSFLKNRLHGQRHHAPIRQQVLPFCTLPLVKVSFPLKTTPVPWVCSLGVLNNWLLSITFWKKIIKYSGVLLLFFGQYFHPLLVIHLKVWNRILTPTNFFPFMFQEILIFFLKKNRGFNGPWN